MKIKALEANHETGFTIREIGQNACVGLSATPPKPQKLRLSTELVNIHALSQNLSLKDHRKTSTTSYRSSSRRRHRHNDPTNACTSMDRTLTPRPTKSIKSLLPHMSPRTTRGPEVLHGFMARECSKTQCRLGDRDDATTAVYGTCLRQCNNFDQYRSVQGSG